MLHEREPVATPEINESRLISLFLQLVSINSPSRSEAEVVRWTKQYLLDAGLEVAEDASSEATGSNANNLIAWLRGSVGHAPKVFLSAHFDTVEPTPNIEVEERDGIFYTNSDTVLGADDKGGMASAIEAVLAVKESGAPHGDICLLLSTCEEIGLLGAAALKIEELGLDFGYVLDTGPPIGSFVNNTATHDKINFKVVGTPSHAGNAPEKGVNAIVVAAKAIAAMKSGRIDFETTANVGIVEGGQAVNVVCPQVTIQCEARSGSVEKLDAQVNHMIACFEEAAREMGAMVEVDHKRHYHSYFIDPSQPVVKFALAGAKALGYDPSLRQALGGSDANVYNEKGVPCIVMATGMQKIHTHDEFIARMDMVSNARLTARILLDIGAGNSE